MAMEQALDATPKTLDKTPDGSNVAAAAQWQQGDGWKNAMQQMLPADTGSQHLPNFSIDNSGSGNITFNIDMNSHAPELPSAQSSDGQPMSQFDRQMQTVEQDLQRVETDMQNFEKMISTLGLNGTNPPAGGGTDIPNLPTGGGGSDTTNPPATGGGADTPNPPTIGGFDSTNPPATGGVTDTPNPPTGGGSDITNPPATSGGTDSTTPITVPANGQFTVQNGQIIGPDGKPFVAKGVAAYAGEAAADADQITKDFPGVNMIRLATDPNGDSMQSVQDAINAFTAKGIVVEVEDHHSAGGEMNTYTGQDLTNQENWYAQIAAANKNNPDVWFGTPNEPNSANPQDIVDQEAGVYNAIRGAGNNNMVMLELQGGGTATPMQADASAYQNMQNVAWDAHYYGWVNNYESGSGVAADLNTEVQQAQMVTGGQGTIPVIVGEYGNSTDGQNIDANGDDVINAVQQSGLGTIAWAWNNSGSPKQADSLTDGSGNLTEMGQLVAQHIDG